MRRVFHLGDVNSGSLRKIVAGFAGEPALGAAGSGRAGDFAEGASDALVGGWRGGGGAWDEGHFEVGRLGRTRAFLLGPGPIDGTKGAVCWDVFVDTKFNGGSPLSFGRNVIFIVRITAIVSPVFMIRDIFKEYSMIINIVN